MDYNSDLHEPRTNAEQSETAADLRVSFESRLRGMRLAKPNTRVNPLNAMLFDHHDGPYVADYWQKGLCWRVWWDGWDRDERLRFDTQAEAVSAMHLLAARWRATEGCKVYFIGAQSGPVKIGIAFNPKARLNTLQTAHWEKLELLAVRKGGEKEERAYHRRFGKHRLSGEWFERCRPIEAEIARINAPKPQEEGESNG